MAEIAEEEESCEQRVAVAKAASMRAISSSLTTSISISSGICVGVSFLMSWVDSAGELDMFFGATWCGVDVVVRNTLPLGSPRLMVSDIGSGGVVLLLNIF